MRETIKINLGKKKGNKNPRTINIQGGYSRFKWRGVRSEVPEEVQQFIESISKESKTKSESSSELNLLGVKKTKVKRLANSKSGDKVLSSRRASVQ